MSVWRSGVCGFKRCFALVTLLLSCGALTGLRADYWELTTVTPSTTFTPENATNPKAYRIVTPTDGRIHVRAYQEVMGSSRIDDWTGDITWTAFPAIVTGDTVASRTFTVDVSATVSGSGFFQLESVVQVFRGVEVTPTNTLIVVRHDQRSDGKHLTFVAPRPPTILLNPSDGRFQVQVLAVTSGTVLYEYSLRRGAASPPPAITRLEPNSASVGAAGFDLTVRGSNFVSGATVTWNEFNLATQFVSATELRAAVPAGRLAASGSQSVRVRNPNGQLSNPLTFMVDANPPPVINSMTPTQAPAGLDGFPFAVYGSNFRNGAVVLWEGAPVTTTSSVRPNSMAW